VEIEKDLKILKRNSSFKEDFTEKGSGRKENAHDGFISTENIHLPLIFTEMLNRESGLGILVGNKNCKINHSMNLILTELGLNRGGQTMVVSRETRIIPKNGKMSFAHYALEEWLLNPDWRSFQNSNVVVFDGLEDMKVLESLLKLVEAGTLVLWTFTGSSLLNGLQQIFSSIAAPGLHHLRARFAEAFFGGICQFRLESAQQEAAYAFEVLMNKKEVQELLQEDRLQEISALQDSATEKSGILALNQSLIQLIIRRKIDIKSAFKCTKNPQNLDQLLKKLGI